MNWKGFGRNRLSHYPGIFLGELMKTAKTLSRVRERLGRDPNLAPTAILLYQFARCKKLIGSVKERYTEYRYTIKIIQNYYNLYRGIYNEEKLKLYLKNTIFWDIILKTELICSSEISADFQRTTRRYIPEESTIHNHCCENLRSEIIPIHNAE
jgi:hypothetical protein